jgi:hypothetical protein
MQYRFIQNWHKNPNLWLLVLTAMVTIVMFAHPPIPQLINYNQFANQCTWLGLPHAENVLSNLPFLFVGTWGLYRLQHYAIASNIERLCWIGFFMGVTLTAFGSSYYHLQPDNWRLVWDRLPIVFSFICLFAAMLAERVSIATAIVSLFPMLIYSIGSVFYWYITESVGQGDMRAYILVQLLPILLIPIIMTLYSPKYTKSWMLLLIALWYLFAKVCEGLDGPIYELTGHIGGHAIKHLFASMACIQVAWMLEKRKELCCLKILSI